MDGVSDAPRDVALKEWALVCDLLLAGEQVVLLRKGGIHEPRRGFAIEHDAFLLYPNVEHQRAEQLRPDLRPRLDAAPAPPREQGTVTLPGYCLVTDVIRVPDAQRAYALEPLTCWTPPFFDLRLRYKPERPLFAVVVRAHRLLRPASIPYHRLYAGCRSWVPLREALPEDALAGARPALDDAAFAARRADVRAALDAERA
jgi:hypothetical protein